MSTENGRRRPAANGHGGSSLGERLRSERSARGLSLRELALDDLDPPPSTAEDSPAPARSAAARSAQGSTPVLRASDGSAIQLESGVRWERLTARTEKGVEFEDAHAIWVVLGRQQVG